MGLLVRVQLWHPHIDMCFQAAGQRKYLSMRSIAVRVQRFELLDVRLGCKVAMLPARAAFARVSFEPQCQYILPGPLGGPSVFLSMMS